MLKIPRFTLHNNSLQGTRQHCIACSNEVVHVIKDLNEFYLDLGYKANDPSNNLLPDEYLWEAFVKNSATYNCDACFQLRAIDYLTKHSKLFSEKFGDNFNYIVRMHMQLKFACPNNRCSEKSYRIVAV